MSFGFEIAMFIMVAGYGTLAIIKLSDIHEALEKIVDERD